MDVSEQWEQLNHLLSEALGDLRWSLESLSDQQIGYLVDALTDRLVARVLVQEDHDGGL